MLFFINLKYVLFYKHFCYSSFEINSLQNQQNLDISFEDDTNYYDYENVSQSTNKEKNKRKRSNSEPRTSK